jgi:hypothetical protein
VIIYQKPVILMKQAIMLVNVGFGEYNGTDTPHAALWLHVLTSPRQLAKHMLLNLYLLK